ncbi:MAG TPA: bifunctional 3,4-dihydroxy-2-butanone-4-phosphate synthase/GTP cyclohydrolase II [Fibrobacteraceae bacterium]|nr:bifunctional 3,4-dihydroxy-2-butanone-4-phosphate synthase/GTP cyclohydrolase II [Fibrobacteraceae bacterium]
MLNTIEEALEDFRQGRMLIVADDEDRESEGDFVCAAALCTTEHVNFMVTHGRGLVCAPMDAKRVDALRLPMMAARNTSRFETAFTVSVEAREGTTTGISAAERALTIRSLANLQNGPDDFVSPGHVFPLRAREGGVLVRPGHTEATVDLARLAGMEPVGALCEIMNEDGSMARMPQLQEISKKQGIKIISVADLIAYRLRLEKLVVCEAAPKIPTEAGKFQVYGYRSLLDNTEHVAWVNGNIDPEGITNVRVHSECLTGDVFHSMRCDCGEQLQAAMRYIGKHGGVLLYMRGHEGRGIGLINKLKAYELQEQGLDTVEANVHLGFKPDMRSYGIGAQILADLGVRRMRLLTNNPRKLEGLAGFNLEIVERIPIEIRPNPVNQTYMQTKRDKMGHILQQPLEPSA